MFDFKGIKIIKNKDGEYVEETENFQDEV